MSKRDATGKRNARRHEDERPTATQTPRPHAAILAEHDECARRLGLAEYKRRVAQADCDALASKMLELNREAAALPATKESP